MCTYHCCSELIHTFKGVETLRLPVDSLVDFTDGSLGEERLFKLELFYAFQLLSGGALVRNHDCLPRVNRWRKIFTFLIHILLSKLSL